MRIIKLILQLKMFRDFWTTFGLGVFVCTNQTEWK